MLRQLLFLIVLGTTAFAQTNYKTKTYNSFEELHADTRKRCELISHDCEICSFHDGGKLTCSSSGIACVPKRWICYIKEGD